MSSITTSKPVPFTIECKRVLLPGVVIHSVCPRCGKKISTDLSKNYLSYPRFNETVIEGIPCPHCEEDGHVISAEVPLRFRVVVEIAEGEDDEDGDEDEDEDDEDEDEDEDDEDATDE